MKVAFRFAIPLLFSLTLPAQRPWQQITVPTIREAAANFKTPPREYGAIQPFASWNGPDAKDRMARIVQDLDRLAANGIFVFNMSPGRGEPKYLSPEHMDEVKFVVQEAAKRGMKLWIQDESDYPSGFAGGIIGQRYPQLTMQGIVADTRISVTARPDSLLPRCRRARWERFGRVVWTNSTGVIPLPLRRPVHLDRAQYRLQSR